MIAGIVYAVVLIVVGLTGIVALVRGGR